MTHDEFMAAIRQYARVELDLAVALALRPDLERRQTRSGVPYLAARR